MKRLITLVFSILLFIIALLFSLKNQQIVNVNYVLAQSELRLSTLLAIIFFCGFFVATLCSMYFYLKLKIKNSQLTKNNKKQRKELNILRSAESKE
ncbi:LapA family protein [Psychromonas sp. CD1]|uniref:LapA family protein n=1 Tax=Psychromonas sp. CD1 TaxID=1979839 RepID=UPI000B9A2079|nr:lipopolysaccharide assembly protein LapA domain-containing protein [Psychromonas sp. CD1]